MAFEGTMFKDIALGHIVAEFITLCLYQYIFLLLSSYEEDMKHSNFIREH